MLKNLMMGAAAVALSVGAMTGAANAGIYRFHAHLSPANEVGSSDPGLTGSGFGVMYYNDRGTIGTTNVLAGDYLDGNGNGVDDDYEDDGYRFTISFGPLGSTTAGAPVPNPTFVVTQAHNHLGVRGTNGSVITDVDAADAVPLPNFSPLETAGYAIGTYHSVIAALFDGTFVDLLAPLAAIPEQGDPDPFAGPNDVYDAGDVIENLLSYAYGTNDDGRLPNAHGDLDTNWYVNLHTTISDGAGPLGTGHIRDQWQFREIPEPASLTLLGAGIMGLGYFGKRRKA
ncbi:MAG: PEP-CTERM sorting domain-containing protein [Pseudomonadota bacterium]